MAERVTVLGLGSVGSVPAAAPTRRGPARTRPDVGDCGDAIVAVAHGKFMEIGAEAIRGLGKRGPLLYDIEGILGRSGADMRP